jgi:cytochrome c oxidase subunit 3
MIEMVESQELAGTKRSSPYQLGMMVFILLAILTAIEFVFALYLNVWPLLAVVALLKGGLVMYYYMHIYRLFEEEKVEDRESFAYKLATNRIGLWFFLLSDGFLFGGLFVSRLNLLGLSRPDVDQVLGLTITSVLLISSFFANRAEVSMENGNRSRTLSSLLITILLGVAFIAAVLFIEWRIAPFGPADGVQGAVFYSMTGFHAFHVLTGVIFLSIVRRNVAHNVYSPEKHWAVEASVVYWHFVDFVWVFFYPALYLIGTVVH